jgi:hypothetical protein
MKLTEETLLDSPDYTLELTYQWEGSLPSTVMVWYDKDTDLYIAQFAGFAAHRFRHFGSLVSWLGDLPQMEGWC